MEKWKTYNHKYMNLKNKIKELAGDVMDYADRKGYGLGECGYYFEVWAFDMIQDEYDAALEYTIDTGEGIDWKERTRLKEEQPEIFAKWRELADGAEEMADKLQEMGISRIS